MEYLQIKAESLHFNLIVIVSFQIQSAGVQSQNNQNKCVTVPILLELTVLFHFLRGAKLFSPDTYATTFTQSKCFYFTRQVS